MIQNLEKLSSLKHKSLNKNNFNQLSTPSIVSSNNNFFQMQRKDTNSFNSLNHVISNDEKSKSIYFNETLNSNFRVKQDSISSNYNNNMALKNTKHTSIATESSNNNTYRVNHQKSKSYFLSGGAVKSALKNYIKNNENKENENSNSYNNVNNTTSSNKNITPLKISFKEAASKKSLMSIYKFNQNSSNDILQKLQKTKSRFLNSISKSIVKITNMTDEKFEEEYYKKDENKIREHTDLYNQISEDALLVSQRIESEIKTIKMKIELLKNAENENQHSRIFQSILPRNLIIIKTKKEAKLEDRMNSDKEKSNKNNNNYNTKENEYHAQYLKALSDISSLISPSNNENTIKKFYKEDQELVKKLNHFNTEQAYEKNQIYYLESKFKQNKAEVFLKTHTNNIETVNIYNDEKMSKFNEKDFIFDKEYLKFKIAKNVKKDDNNNVENKLGLLLKDKMNMNVIRDIIYNKTNYLELVNDFDKFNEELNKEEINNEQIEFLHDNFPKFQSDLSNSKNMILKVIKPNDALEAIKNNKKGNLKESSIIKNKNPPISFFTKHASMNFNTIDDEKENNGNLNHISGIPASRRQNKSLQTTISHKLSNNLSLMKNNDSIPKINTNINSNNNNLISNFLKPKLPLAPQQVKVISKGIRKSAVFTNNVIYLDQNNDKMSVFSNNEDELLSNKLFDNKSILNTSAYNMSIISKTSKIENEKDNNNKNNQNRLDYLTRLDNYSKEKQKQLEFKDLQELYKGECSKLETVTEKINTVQAKIEELNSEIEVINHEQYQELIKYENEKIALNINTSSNEKKPNDSSLSLKKLTVNNNTNNTNNSASPSYYNKSTFNINNERNRNPSFNRERKVSDADSLAISNVQVSNVNLSIRPPRKSTKSKKRTKIINQTNIEIKETALKLQFSFKKNTEERNDRIKNFKREIYVYSYLRESLKLDSANLEKRISKIESKLNEVKSDLILHYHTLLIDGKDTRDSGISWIIRAIWGLNSEVIISYLPRFLDEKLISFIFLYSHKMIELGKVKDLLIEIKQRVKHYNGIKMRRKVNLKQFKRKQVSNMNLLLISID